MVTSNSRDVELAIGVTTSGTGEVDALRKAVGDLAKGGGDAAPEFARLAAELDKVAGQQAALATFSTIRREVADLGVAMDKAAAEVERLGAELPAVKANAATFAQAQREAGDAVKQTGDALKAAKASYQALREETPKGSRDTLEYKAAASQLKGTIDTLSATMRTQKAEYREISDGAKTAAAAQRASTDAYTKAERAAASLSGELGRQNTALEESRAALESAGVASTSLVDSQARIRAAFETTRGAIEREATALAEARSREAAGARELAAAQQVLGSSLDFERTARQAQAERELTAARERSEASVKALADAQRLLDAERALSSGAAKQEQGIADALGRSEHAARDAAAAEQALSGSRQGGGERVATQEAAVAAARARSETATRELAEAERTFIAAVRGGVATLGESEAAARRVAGAQEALQATLTTQGIDRQAEAQRGLTAAREQAAATARVLAEAQRQLDLGGDAAGAAQRVQAVAEARRQSEAAARSLAVAERVLADETRLAAAAQDAALAAERARALQAQASAALIESNALRTARQEAAERALAVARGVNDAATRRLADAQQQLAAGRDSGDQARVATQELAVAEARRQSDRATRELTAAQQALNNTLDAERTTRQAGAERDLAAARDRSQAATEKLAVAQQALEAARADGNVKVLAQQEADVATARGRAEAATKELTAAQRALVEVVRVSVQAGAQDVAATRARAEQALAAAAAVREQGRAAQEALDRAFSTTGARSAQAIQAELRGIDEALTRIAQDARTTGADFDRAFTASRARVEALKAELAGLPATVKATTRETNLLADGIRQASVYFSAFTVGKEFIEANTQLETLRRTLTIVTGSASTASAQIDFLRKTAQDSGVAVASITGSYSKFAASAIAAGIDLQVVNRTFADVTKAAGLLGLSSDEVGGALNALGQIASKGKVSMEELGQQLGERLPAVLATTAKGLGVTTQELVRLMERGELLADSNFFAAFGKGIEDAFLKGQGQVTGLNASIGRLKNSVTELYTKIGESGGVSALSTGIEFLTGVAKRAGGEVSSLVGYIRDLGKTLDSSSNFVIRFLGRLTGTEVNKFADDTNKAATATAALRDGTQSTDSFIRRLFGATKEAGDGAAYLAIENRRGADALAATGEAAKKAEKAAKDLADADGSAALAAAGASSQYIKITADYARIIDLADKASEQSTKLAAAKKVESEASLALVQIGGNEVEIRKASVEAAVANGNALRTVADAHTLEANLIRAKIDALTAEAIAHGGLNEAIRKQLADLELLFKSKDAEAEKARQAADAAKTEVAARVALRDSYGDQSARIKELTANVDFYLGKVAILRIEQAKGIDRSKELSDADRQLARAQGELKKGLEDVALAFTLKAAKIRQDTDLSVAALSVSKASYEAQAQVFELQGNERAALDARIAGKRVEIDIIRAKMEAQKLESAAIIAGAEAERAALLVSDPGNKAKLAAIDASIAHARVLLLEAEAAGKNVDVLREQINVLERNGVQRRSSNDSISAGTDAIGRNTDGFVSNSKAVDDNRSALEKNIDAQYRLERAAAIARGSLSSSVVAGNKTNFSVLGQNTDSSGFATDSSGNRIGSSEQLTIPAGYFFDKGAFDREVQASLHNVAGTSRGYVDPHRFIKPSGGNTGVIDKTNPIVPPGGSGYSPLGAADRALAALETARSTPPPAPAPSSTPSAVPSSVHTVNISLAGKIPTSINVATASDGLALADFMRQLEQQARSAGVTINR